jgi:hypothetical protein
MGNHQFLLRLEDGEMLAGHDREACRAPMLLGMQAMPSPAPGARANPVGGRRMRDRECEAS